MALMPNQRPCNEERAVQEKLQKLRAVLATELKHKNAHVTCNKAMLHSQEVHTHPKQSLCARHCLATPVFCEHHPHSIVNLSIKFIITFSQSCLFLLASWLASHILLSTWSAKRYELSVAPNTTNAMTMLCWRAVMRDHIMLLHT
eukprot:4377883-Amphidinium_carterae.1